VHGADVRRITDAVPAPEDRPRVDGQATARRDVALAALTADCLPIAVAGGGAVAMLHAGWRGLRAGVIAEGVRALLELGDAEGPGELAGAIGPGAGPCCYQVGSEVHAEFAAVAAAHHENNLDLKAIALRQLVDAGLPARAVHDLGLCTLCAPDGLLFSHRRDRGITGRQAGIAWLT
jgi:YfiH family protein